MKTIKTVAVIGAGVMGRQIALNAAASGFDTVLADSFPDACDKAKAWANSYIGGRVEKGKMKKDAADSALDHLIYTESIKEAVSGRDLIIEAIIEDEGIKRDLFVQVDNRAPKDAIIATNSSFIPSSRFAGDIENPGRLCNLHYFNPAMLMKLVEIVRGEHTDEGTVESLKAFVPALGKEYIVVNKEIDGFVVNRLLRAVQNEAFFLFSNGIASFGDIDTGAEKGLNYPMGPFRLLDLTGIDICYMNRLAVYEKTGMPEDKPPEFLKEKYEKGEFGKKAGKGWYDYRTGGETNA